MAVHKKSLLQDAMSGWVGYIFYGALGVLIAFLLNQTLAFALSTDLPVVAVVSNSMLHDAGTESNHFNWLAQNLGYNRTYVDSWPARDGFSIGDLPIVQGSKEYKVGDVIVYSVAGQKAPIIHRIIKINPDGTFMTKGDHNPSLLQFESRVTNAQIHGKVLFVIPKLGYFKVVATKLTGGL